MEEIKSLFVIRRSTASLVGPESFERLVEGRKERNLSEVYDFIGGTDLNVYMFVDTLDETYELISAAGDSVVVTVVEAYDPEDGVTVPHFGALTYLIKLIPVRHSFEVTAEPVGFEMSAGKDISPSTGQTHLDNVNESFSHDEVNRQDEVN